METVRPCGCKGIRTCLICEEEYAIAKPDIAADLKVNKIYFTFFLYLLNYSTI